MLAIGLMDGDDAGICGNLSAGIYNRSNGQAVATPIIVTAGMERDSLCFAATCLCDWSRVCNVSCQAALEMIGTSRGYTATRHQSDHRQEQHVVVTSGYCSDDNGSVIPRQEDDEMPAAATFVFNVVRENGLPTRSFADCEAVVSAWLGVGQYNIHGHLGYCDGVGWMRLWHAPELQSRNAALACPTRRLSTNSTGCSSVSTIARRFYFAKCGSPTALWVNTSMNSMCDVMTDDCAMALLCATAATAWCLCLSLAVHWYQIYTVRARVSFRPRRMRRLSAEQWLAMDM